MLFSKIILCLLALNMPDWTVLYNGRDLSAWHVEGKGAQLTSWKANGELLQCVAKNGGYLCAEKEYGDFDLELDYRLGKGGNSGVGIRFPKGGWPSVDGMEIQLLDDHDPQYAAIKPEQKNASIYTFVAPKVDVQKPPGQWNHIEIHCDGPNIRIRLNGKEVVKASMDDFPDNVGKGTVALAKRPRSGLVGLQCHGDLVDFKRIRIREIVH